MIKTITKVEGLKKTYNQRRLLEAVEVYNEHLKKDEINAELWYEAVSELLGELEEENASINSILDEATHFMGMYDKLHKDIKDKTIDMKVRALLKSSITRPLFLLQVVYIAKHSKYQTLEGFIGRGYNKAFQRAMGE